MNAPTRVETKNGAGVVVQYKMNTIWNPWCSRDSDEIGGYFIDSLTSYALSLMSDAKQKNLRSGNDANSTPRTEDGEQSGTNTQSHCWRRPHRGAGCDECGVSDAPDSHRGVYGAGRDGDLMTQAGVERPALGPETVGKSDQCSYP